METELTLRYALIGVLLILSAFFAGCEVAFFSLTRIQVTRLRAEGGRAGKKVATLLKDPRRLLVSIYIGNELVNVAISAIATFIALELFDDIGIALCLGFGAFLLLLFGEITPKTVAHRHHERWAMLAAYPLSLFMALIWPAQVMLSRLSARIVSAFGGDSGTGETLLTEDELLTMVEEGADDGVFDEDEKEMIQSVFEFGDTTVSELMTPRTDVFAIDETATLVEAWDQISGTTYARAPVYSGSIDNVIGALYKKDLLKFEYPPASDIELASVLRKPFVVPETMLVEELLHELKKRKTHLALAMDEYGGLAGIVTMDDLISELVGERLTQTDTDNDHLSKVGPGRYRLLAAMEIDEFNTKLNTTLSHDDIETIGGYVFHLFGRAPSAGESVSEQNLTFTVEEMTGLRITHLILHVAEEEES